MHVPGIYRLQKLTLKNNWFQEKMERAANERQEKGQKLRGKRHKLSLTPATSHSVIPSRWPIFPTLEIIPVCYPRMVTLKMDSLLQVTNIVVTLDMVSPSWRVMTKILDTIQVHFLSKKASYSNRSPRPQKSFAIKDTRAFLEILWHRKWMVIFETELQIADKLQLCKNLSHFMSGLR